MRLLIAEDDQGACRRPAARAACQGRSGGPRGHGTRPTGLATTSSTCSSSTSACRACMAWRCCASCAARLQHASAHSTGADSVEQRVQVWTWAPTTTWPSPSRCRSWKPRVRALTGAPGHGGQRDQHGPLDLRPTGRVAISTSKMSDSRPADLAAGGAAAACGAPGRSRQLVEQLCEWGRKRSTTTPSRSTSTACAEDRAGLHPHRHHARPGLCLEKSLHGSTTPSASTAAAPPRVGRLAPGGPTLRP